ncbi:TetR family transcriptional regulator [Bacillus sp. FJAT-27231]|uniref:TetR/AcrR family transcriptional regulator n=1 Tax=Bacillus sp. FJAT-27231 TaxID=1679168 RepID=UPI00067128B3|nr:TetR/AcrR family transcriptional regulator [Bacillus sp. FJAT-27231]KMY53089.1 TetR family transcriptional regulator [Bacillus sp. FJAT-27231]
MAKPNVIEKSDLLNFAKECLVDQGIEKFTLRAVAERAGVTQGTVYYHFRTKEQLLVDTVKDVCDRSWDELSESDGNMIKQALTSAKSRCSHDSFYHKLFFTLMAAGMTNEKMREQLGDLLKKENKALFQSLAKVWTQSPIKGVSLETWAILLNAIVDGLAVQALMNKDFPVEQVYEALEQVLTSLSNLTMEKDSV